MNVQDFLSRLEGVKRTGKGKWLARCPAHADRSPSLSVGEGDDGRVLIKCFAECSPDEVVGAVGLELSVLFPERIEHAPSIKRPYNPADVLEALADEALVLGVFICDIEKGLTPKQEDFDRALVAVERILAARRLALGR